MCKLKNSDFDNLKYSNDLLGRTAARTSWKCFAATLVASLAPWPIRQAMGRRASVFAVSLAVDRRHFFWAEREVVNVQILSQMNRVCRCSYVGDWRLVLHKPPQCNLHGRLVV